jgi:predicted adenine nucleotide alpha hydrolase (AANH) superfamily ATPase
LSNYFEITVYFYNPNINIPGEYEIRKEEQLKLIDQLESGTEIKFIEGEFNTRDFLDKIRGLETVSEGGERCFECYHLRLEKSVQLAKERGFEYFTTSLTISPLKNSNKLNEIGFELEEKYGIKWLRSDFKKKNGYKRSVELSIEHGLYRQDYCGCSFSKAESDRRKSEMK